MRVCGKHPWRAQAAYEGWESLRSSPTPTKGEGESRVRDHPGLAVSFGMCLDTKKKINTDHGKVAKHPSRTTRTLLGLAKLRLGRLSLAKPRRDMRTCPVKKE